MIAVVSAAHHDKKADTKAKKVAAPKTSATKVEHTKEKKAPSSAEVAKKAEEKTEKAEKEAAKKSAELAKKTEEEAKKEEKKQER